MPLSMNRFSRLILCAFLCWPVSIYAQSWSAYGGDGGRQHSELNQINPSNLDKLQLAWRMRTGDMSEGFARKSHSLQTQPVFWNGTLFVSTTSNWVLALDAVSGEILWRFDPGLPKEISYSEGASRGVSLWQGSDSVCPERVFIGTLLGEIYALDAKTGDRCANFGIDGRVDMSEGVGDVNQGQYGITSPPAVLGDQLIVGSAIGDNRAARLERGIVRALDVRSGAINWLWDPIPTSPQQSSYSSWENDSAPRTGAANVWPPISVDAQLDLVFVSTGSPSPDFYGGERLGDNHYANSLVALNGTTGAVVWSQQLVHHDVWDYDIPSQPTLTMLDREGQTVPAVMVVTKTGMLYAFNRSTGAPIYEVFEQQVPVSDVLGERLSPSQPMSSFPAFADQSAQSEADAFGLLWFDKRSCARTLKEFRSEGIFTPPTLQGSIMNPSYGGGANWGGVAVDTDRQIALVHVNQIPALVRLIPRDELAAVLENEDMSDWDISQQAGTPYYMARKIFLSPLGLPCTSPPWGKLVAMDLAREQILWEIPLGTIRDLAPGIVPNFAWGVPGMGGPLTTGSGLTVIGASAEHVVRIFATETGEELWHYDLPTSANATPMSYEHDGEQYIVIAVGGHDALGMPRGDYIYSFKLGSRE